MIIAGIILSVFGLLLCFTVILLPVGLILFFVGATLTTIGMFRPRKTVITNVVQVSNTPGQGMQANIPVDTNAGRVPEGRRIEPPFDGGQHHQVPSAPGMIDVTPQSTQTCSYDRAKWDALVKYDDDIARIAKALAQYDTKYTDEFAAAYLVLNDKAYLPMIVQKIMASAKQDATGRRA